MLGGRRSPVSKNFLKIMLDGLTQKTRPYQDQQRVATLPHRCLMRFPDAFPLDGAVWTLHHIDGALSALEYRLGDAFVSSAHRLRWPLRVSNLAFPPARTTYLGIPATREIWT